MIVAFTGHRPDKLEGLASSVSDAIRWFLVRTGPERAISGMALGVDQLAAAWCRILRIPWIAAIPFPGQDVRWSGQQRKQYEKLLEDASDIVVLDKEYHPWSFQKRNEWMVDNSELLASVWDGSAGGTANCVRYAESIGRKIEPLWEAKWATERSVIVTSIVR